MSTLFSHTSLPFWVWIVIIVVGSLVVLGTIAFTIRFIVVRRRQAGFLDTFGNEDIPQRRMTVRRGRVVEHSKYLSLTGSRFGLNAFGADDNDASSRAGARSKSPFEWWQGVKDRSQSRSSQVTQITNDTSSIYGPPSPAHSKIYQRRDFNQSTTSLASSTKEDTSTVTVTEMASSPPRVVRNFSRSFSRQGHGSTYASRVHTLSRIEESSPHTSMISTKHSRMASHASNQVDARMSTPPVSTAHLTNTSRSSQDLNTSRKSSIHQDSQDSPFEDLPIPPPIAYGGSRSSFGDAEPRHLRISSRDSSLAGSTQSQRQSQTTVLSEAPPPPKQANSYWDTRADLHPVRTSSRKGNVLRKKSLRRADMVTQVDS